MKKSIDSIVNHSLNRSKSKSAHKFSTAERFPKTKGSVYFIGDVDVSNLPTI